MFSVKLQSRPSVVVQYGQEAGWRMTVDLLEESGKHLENPLWRTGAVCRDMEKQKGITRVAPGPSQGCRT